jgi:hypothetical protein
MLKPFSKLILFGLLSAALALSAVAVEPVEAGLCNQDPTCTDNGCAASHGVCAAFSKNGACFCAYPVQTE